MLEIDRKEWIFKTKEIWFCEDPMDYDSVNLNGYDSVTFNACKNRVNLQDFDRTEHFTLLTYLTQGLDAIWRNMDKSCRYAISRAVRDGVEIKVNQDYDRFYILNRSFRKIKGLAAWSEVEDLREVGALFVSELNGELLGGQFYLEDQSHIRLLIGASKRLQVTKQMASLIGKANRLLVWEAIKYAKAKGMIQFDLGGYYMGEHGKNEERERINFFKRGFGGQLTALYTYRRDFSKTYTWAKKCYDIKEIMSRQLQL